MIFTPAHKQVNPSKAPGQVVNPVRGHYPMGSPLNAAQLGKLLSAQAALHQLRSDDSVPDYVVRAAERAVETYRQGNDPSEGDFVIIKAYLMKRQQQDRYGN